MATPRERALGLLHGFLQLQLWPARPDPDELEGTLGALESVGLLSLEDAEVWRAEVAAAPQPQACDATSFEKAAAEARRTELARATRQPQVGDGASFEKAAGMLSELLDAAGHGETPDQLAFARFEGALTALAEARTVDRAEWDARVRERWPSVQQASHEGEADEACGPVHVGAGTEQELVGVIGGSSELLDGWRVLYGLRFEDGITFTLWRDPGAGPGPRDWNAQDRLITLDLRDNVGTKYGGVDEWGAEDGAHGVSFAIPPPADATWVELVNEAGDAVRLAL